MRFTANTKDFHAKMTQLQASVDTGVVAGVGEIVLQIGQRADELVPFDTGELSRSQRTSVAVSKTTVVGTVRYGSAAAPYALKQHEDLTLSHPPKPPGNSKGRSGFGPTSPGTKFSPKYLEYPAKQVGKNAEKIMAAAIKARGA
jgi:hypothetical protein